MHLISN